MAASSRDDTNAIAYEQSTNVIERYITVTFDLPDIASAAEVDVDAQA